MSLPMPKLRGFFSISGFWGALALTAPLDGAGATFLPLEDYKYAHKWAEMSENGSNHFVDEKFAFEKTRKNRKEKRTTEALEDKSGI